MKGALILFLAFSFCSIPAILPAQCSGQHCLNGPPDVALCAEDACISCDLSNLNGYQGATVPDMNTCDYPGPFCGSIENNQWFAFVAPTETVTFSFEVSNCVGPQQNGSGIQAEVYATNDCNVFTSVSNCWNPGTETPGSVIAQGLTIGNTYFLMVDGWANDWCDFTISVDSASLSASVFLAPSFSGPTLNCPNTISEHITNSGCLTDFTWSFEGNGNLTSGADSTHVFIEWGTPAIGTLCLEATLPDGTVSETCVQMEALDYGPTTLFTAPLASAPGITEICLGDDFMADAYNSFLGAPNDSLLHFEFSFGDGTFRSGPVANHQYEVEGEYELRLFVHLEGCEIFDTISHTVRVFPLPSANISGIPLDGICPGTELTLTSESFSENLNINPILFERQTYPAPLPLPNNADSSLMPELQIIGTAPGAILSSIENFKVCVQMEHSWMRDLEITLTCPSGQEVILHNHLGQIGGEVFLGIPVENDEILPAPVPGIGYEYCWTADAQNGTWLEYANSTVGLETLPSGDYSSFEPLENFIGCPIEGEWTLTLTDNWEIDNGHLFSALIVIDNPEPDVSPISSTGEWAPDPSIVFSDQDSMTAAPSFSTTYFYHVTNDLGCTAEIEVPIDVNDNSPYCFPCDDLWVSMSDDIVVTCDGFASTFIGAATPYPFDSLNFIWTQNGTPVSSSNFLLIEELGEYIVTVEYPILGCSAADTLMFIEDNDLPTAEAGPDISLSNCPEPTAVLDGSASSAGPGFDYVWKNSAGAFVSDEILVTIDAPGIYTLTVTNTDNGCSGSDTVEVFQGPPVSALVESTSDSCGLSIGTAMVNLTPVQFDATFLWSNGSMENPATGLPYGPYSVLVQWSNCPSISFNVLVDSVECIPSSISEIAELESVLLSPNPTEGLATLIFNLEKTAELEMSLMDALGRAVDLGFAPQKLTPGEHYFDLDLSSLPGGVYFLKIQNGGGQVSTLRVVKQ